MVVPGVDDANRKTSSARIRAGQLLWEQSTESPSGLLLAAGPHRFNCQQIMEMKPHHRLPVALFALTQGILSSLVMAHTRLETCPSGSTDHNGICVIDLDAINDYHRNWYDGIGQAKNGLGSGSSYYRLERGCLADGTPDPAQAFDNLYSRDNFWTGADGAYNTDDCSQSSGNKEYIWQRADSTPPTPGHTTPITTGTCPGGTEEVTAGTHYGKCGRTSVPSGWSDGHHENNAPACRAQRYCRYIQDGDDFKRVPDPANVWSYSKQTSNIPSSYEGEELGDGIVITWNRGRDGTDCGDENEYIFSNYIKMEQQRKDGLSVRHITAWLRGEDLPATACTL